MRICFKVKTRDREMSVDPKLTSLVLPFHWLKTQIFCEEQEKPPSETTT